MAEVCTGFGDYQSTNSRKQGRDGGGALLSWHLLRQLGCVDVGSPWRDWIQNQATDTNHNAGFNSCHRTGFNSCPRHPSLRERAAAPTGSRSVAQGPPCIASLTFSVSTEDEWEVTSSHFYRRRNTEVSVPPTAIPRVRGKAGCNPGPPGSPASVIQCEDTV